MESVSNIVQLESIKSLQSTKRKLETAFSQMTQKGNNTTLVKKRLNAVSIALATLEEVWYQSPLSYTMEDLAEAHHVLTSLLPSIENSYVKSKLGSPQRTLLERRKKSLELAIEAIDLLQTN